MGGEAVADAAMRRLCWFFAGLLLRLLESEEREFVLGDLSETCASPRQALCQVFGLAIRRQAALWKCLRSWAVLAVVIFPSATLLRFGSSVVADNSAIYLWLYTNYWNWMLVENPGYRYDLLRYICVFGACYIALFALSWKVGVVLGFVSKRGTPVQALLFTVILFGLRESSRTREITGNTAVFAHGFFASIFPLIVLAFFVLFPALWGMRRYISPKEI
jgi:hypothetical protein